jgi:sugar lactone lactonase YvrE
MMEKQKENQGESDSAQTPDIGRTCTEMTTQLYRKFFFLLLATITAVGAIAWGQTTQQGPTLLNTDFVNATGIAVDANGNLYVADAGSAQVDKIEAGTGGAEPGAVSASSTMVAVGSGFTKPTGVAVDAMGDIFVADAGAAKIFEIEAGTGGAAAGTVNSGSTTVVVGSGLKQPVAVAVDAHGNVYVADPAADAVDEIESGTGGAAAGTVNSSSTVMVVGSGFSQPMGVAVDSSGNVYVGDTGNKKVFEIQAGTGGAATGTVNSGSTVEAISTGFTSPQGVAVDGSGDVFFVTPVPGNVYEILAGTGGAAVGTVTAASSEVALGNWTTEPVAVAVKSTGKVFVVASDEVWDVRANSSNGTAPVENFTLSVNQGTSIVSAAQGASVTVPFSVTSTNGFTGMVTMSCTASTGFGCSFQPTAVSLSLGATQTGTLTVTQPPTTAMLRSTGAGSQGAAGSMELASALWIPGLLLGGFAFRKRLARTTRMMVIGLLFFTGMLAISGCYTNPIFHTKQTSYQAVVMVTATGGAVQQNFPLYIQVQLTTPIVGNRSGSTGK